MTSKRIIITIPKDLLERLDKTSKILSIARSAAIQNAIREHLIKMEKQVEFLQSIENGNTNTRDD